MVDDTPRAGQVMERKPILTILLIGLTERTNGFDHQTIDLSAVLLHLGSTPNLAITNIACVLDCEAALRAWKKVSGAIECTRDGTSTSSACVKNDTVAFYAIGLCKTDLLQLIDCILVAIDRLYSLSNSQYNVKLLLIRRFEVAADMSVDAHGAKQQCGQSSC